MARIKCTFFFKDTAGYGWSEVQWTTLQNLTAAMEAAKRLLPSRRMLLGRGAALEFVRVSDEEVKRDSDVFAVPAGDGQLRTGAEDYHDSANLALIVRMDASDPVARRTLYMRGFKDLYAIAGAFSPDALFTQRFRAFKNQLTSDNWAIKKRNPNSIQHTINSITQDIASGEVTVTTATDNFFQAGEPVSFRGVRGVGVPTGTMNVFQRIDNKVFKVKTGLTLGQIASFGGVRRVEYVLTPVTNAQVMRLSHRIAGRPFDAPRGRRQARTRT